MFRLYFLLITTCLLVICCKKDNTCKGCVGNNQAPVANAGIDQTIKLPVNFADLDGSKSSDPDNNIRSYQWTKISGPALFKISDGNASKTLVINLVPGLYLFELKLTDANGASAFDSIQVEVREPLAPVADAGPDQTLQLPKTSVVIDGSNSSDPNSFPLDYNWKRIAGPYHIRYYTPFYDNSQPAKIEMELYGAGEYLFELTVTNREGLSDTDVVNITVTNGPVTAHAIDMVFSENSFYGISGILDSEDFILRGTSPSSFTGNSIFSNVQIFQEFETTSPGLSLYDESGWLEFQFNSNINFFKLPYNGSTTNFADSVFVTSGTGWFSNVRKGTRIYCTGTANITNHTGSIRLQGTIYY